ncbi:MAG: D-amino acid oxidase family protein, partial [Caulobacteraceae bacterium]|nr:D-amino acid oxidase family protein [Caulobacteraceae bacterium]
MNDLKGLRVVVAGAGAIGSVLALQLARQGAQVMLADPAATGDNASGVAAGMLAPAFEALLDPVSAALYPLMRAARDAWPAIVQAAPSAPPLDRTGAMLRLTDVETGAAMLARLVALGGRGRLIDSAEARSLAPGLAAEGPYLFTSEDWRLEASATLLALHDAFRKAGGRRLTSAAVGFDRGMVRFEGAEAKGADLVILATGPKAGGWPDALGDAHLSPIKGQILRFPGVRQRTGPVVRGPGAYVAPGANGLVVGATMEQGRSDLAIDPEAVAQLRSAAAALFPKLADASFIAAAG